MGDVIGRGYFITGTDTGVGKTVFTSAFVRAIQDEGLRIAAYKPVCSGAEYSDSLSPTIDLPIPSELTAGERARVKGPHSPGQPPPPDSLPHFGAVTESNIDRGGEGAELAAYPTLPRPYWSDIEAHYAATNAAFPRERLGPQTFLAPLSPPAAAALEGREVDEALLVDGYRWLAERADLVLVEGAGGFYSPISTNWLNADLAERIELPVIIVTPNRLGTINQTLLTIEAVRQRGLTVAGVVLNLMSESIDPSTASNAAEIRDRGRVTVWGEIPFSSPAELQPSRLPESMILEHWRFCSENRRCSSSPSSPPSHPLPRQTETP